MFLSQEVSIIPSTYFRPAGRERSRLRDRWIALHCLSSSF